jgi:phospholipase C
LLVFNYDEWGGFFDHVPPPTAPIPDADALAGNEDGLLGFRVPCMVVSPFARREHVLAVSSRSHIHLFLRHDRDALGPTTTSTVRDKTAKTIWRRCSGLRASKVWTAKQVSRSNQGVRPAVHW